MSNWIVRLTARRVALLLGVPLFAVSVMQLALGGSAWVVISAVLAAGLGLAGFLVLGAYNTGAWVLLLYALGNVLVPLYAKTLMGQPLGSYLEVPLDSFLIVAVSTGELFLALMVARQLRLGRSLFEATSDVRALGWLSWGSFVLGSLFWFWNNYNQSAQGGGFGGLAVFRDLLLMAIIARTALLFEDSRNCKGMDWILATFIGTSVFLGLLTSHKTAAALPVVSYFVTVAFYREGLRLRYMAALLLGAIVFVGIVAPMLHVWRFLGERHMPIADRVELIASDLAVVFDNKKLGEIRRVARSRFEHGYYDYYGGDGRGQMILGRYSSVQQIDPVIAEVNRQGTVGSQAIWPALLRLLPRSVFPDKPKYIESYYTLVRLGLIQPDGGKHPTLPLAGQAYAAYGWLGVMIIPFGTFLLFLLVLKKLGWNLKRNVFAIFFFCEFVVVYANQGDFGQYMGAAGRNFPVLGAVFFVLLFASRVRVVGTAASRNTGNG